MQGQGVSSNQKRARQLASELGKVPRYLPKQIGINEILMRYEVAYDDQESLAILSSELLE